MLFLSLVNLLFFVSFGTKWRKFQRWDHHHRQQQRQRQHQPFKLTMKSWNHKKSLLRVDSGEGTNLRRHVFLTRLWMLTSLLYPYQAFGPTIPWAGWELVQIVTHPVNTNFKIFFTARFSFPFRFQVSSWTPGNSSCCLYVFLRSCHCKSNKSKWNTVSIATVKSQFQSYK